SSHGASASRRPSSKRRRSSTSSTQPGGRNTTERTWTTRRWRVTSTVTEDPWRDIAPSRKADLLSARRVDASRPYSCAGARGADRRCRLLLQHRTPVVEGKRLPRLNGIEVTLTPGDANGLAVLALRLQESSQRELFHRLCLDIVASASATSS